MLHLTAWWVLLFFSVNTVVLEYRGYDHPVKYLSFGPYHKTRAAAQHPVPEAAVIAAAAAAATPAASAAAAAEASAEAVEKGFRYKRGVASFLTDPGDFDTLAPALSWWYSWGGSVKAPAPVVFSIAAQMGFQSSSVLFPGDEHHPAVAVEDITSALQVARPKCHGIMSPHYTVADGQCHRRGGGGGGHGVCADAVGALGAGHPEPANCDADRPRATANGASGV